MLFRYVVRTILARKASNGSVVAAMAMVIAAGVVSLAFYHGLRANLAVAGRPDNVVVMSGSVLQTTKSGLSKLALDQIKTLPEVAQEGGQLWVSPESHLSLDVGSEVVAIRGVEPVAFQVHDQVQVVDGRRAEPGSAELIIGRRLVGRYPGFQLGGKVAVGLGDPWVVVGVFAAGGSAVESEVWGDRQRVAVELKRTTNLSAVVRVRDAAAVLEFTARLKELKVAAPGAWGISEREYYEATVGNVPLIQKAVAAIIAILVLCAVFAAANALHASFLVRFPEFASLWVLGHRRRRLAVLLLEESLSLCCAAAALSCGLAALAAGIEVTEVLGGEVVFPLPFGPRQVADAFAIAAAIGILGPAYPIFKVLRGDLASALG